MNFTVKSGGELHLPGYSLERVDVSQFFNNASDRVASVEHLLPKLFGHDLSAVELDYGFSESREGSRKIPAWNCVYVLVDQTDKVVYEVRGVAKSRVSPAHSQSAREMIAGALTLDSFLDISDIPTKRVKVCDGLLFGHMDKDFTFELPQPKKSRLCLDNAVRASRRAQGYGIYPVSSEESIGFDLLNTLPRLIEEGFLDTVKAYKAALRMVTLTRGNYAIAS